MKVAPQIITFIVIIVIGWYAYEKHDAFHQLIDDIASYSGLSGEVSEVVQTPAVATAKQQPPQVLAEAAPVVSEKPATEIAPVQADEKPASIHSVESEKSTVPVADTEVTAEQGDSPSATVTAPVTPDDATSGDATIAQEIAESSAAVSESVPAVEVAPADTVDTQGVDASDTSAPTISNESRKQNALSGLAAARAAWHQGDHDKSIMLYSQLMREYENHPDFAGELGNIYFSKGQNDLAVKAYSEALLRLLKNNDYARAQQVLRIIYNIDQEQAVLLRKYFER